MGLSPLSRRIFLELQRRTGIHGESSNPSLRTQQWHSIRRPGVPNPVKLLLWKACHNIILTRENLYERKISVQMLCPICNLEIESVIHTLWECPATNDVWGEDGSPLKKWKADCRDMEDLWSRITDKLPKHSQDLCAIIFRNLWLRRNAFLSLKTSL